MGEVATKFTSDSKQIEQAYDKLYQKNVRLQAKMSEGGKKSRRQHSQATGLITREATSLKNLASGYVSVSSAVGAVVSAYRQWDTRMEAIREKTQEVNRSLVKQLTLTGQTQNAAKIESELSSIPGVMRSDAIAAFGGVLEGAAARPELLADIDRNLKLAVATSPAADLGIDQAAFSRFASKLGTIDATRAPADVTDQALAIMQHLGANFQKFQGGEMFGAIRGLANVMPTDNALAIGIQAALNDTPGLPRQLVDAIERTYDPLTKSQARGLSPEQVSARERLASTSGAERARLILGDQTVADVALGEGNASRLEMSSAQQRAKLLDEVGFDPSRGTMARTVAEQMQFRTGRQVDAENRDEAMSEKVQRRLGLEVRGEELAAARKLLERTTEGRGFLVEGGQRARFEGILAFNEMTKQLPVFGPRGTPVTNTLRAIDETLLPEFADQRNRVEGFEKYTDLGYLTDEALRRQEALLQGIRDEIRAGNDERRSDRRGGATVPSVNER